MSFTVLLGCVEDIASKVTEILDKDVLAISREECEYEIILSMRYVVLAAAKRIRPFLLVQFASIFSVPQSIALKIGAALELVHSYSLVHDDLPALDNDNYRRGQLSCHKNFSECTAILTGDALLTLAFEVLSKVDVKASQKINLISVLAKAAGMLGMIKGQILDIKIKHTHNMSIEELTHIQSLKTGMLFSAACEMGAILGNVTTRQRLVCREYGISLGILFQVMDDIKDEKSDRKKGVKTLRTYFKHDDELTSHINKLLMQTLHYLEKIQPIAERNNTMGALSLLQKFTDFIANKA
ncbi:Farnesyl-diphosphate synthase [Alphaproteobacteria bacterium]